MNTIYTTTITLSIGFQTQRNLRNLRKYWQSFKTLLLKCISVCSERVYMSPGLTRSRISEDIRCADVALHWLPYLALGTATERHIILIVRLIVKRFHHVKSPVISVLFWYLIWFLFVHTNPINNNKLLFGQQKTKKIIKNQQK